LLATEEMPTDEFMSDMLPVDERHPLDDDDDDDAGPVAAADNDEDDLAHSRNGKNVFIKSILYSRKCFGPETTGLQQ